MIHIKGRLKKKAFKEHNKDFEAVAIAIGVMAFIICAGVLLFSCCAV